MSDFKFITPSCVSCDGVCEYTYIPSVVQVAFKDGPSGSWPSKGDRVKKQMMANSIRAEARQRDRYGEAKKALPNYKGQVADTWAEARSEAIRQDGMEVGATFNGKVAEENKNSTKIVL